MLSLPTPAHLSLSYLVFMCFLELNSLSFVNKFPNTYLSLSCYTVF